MDVFAAATEGCSNIKEATVFICRIIYLLHKDAYWYIHNPADNLALV